MIVEKEINDNIRFITSQGIWRKFQDQREIIDDIEECDDKKIKNACKNNNIIILGDFNFHYPFETKIIDDINYVDLLLEREYWWLIYVGFF